MLTGQRAINRSGTSSVVSTFSSSNGSNAKVDAIGVRDLPRNLLYSTATSQLPCVSTMTDKSKQPKKHDGAILSLDVALGLVNIGKEASSMTPAPAVFGIATILLTTIRVSYTSPP